MHRRGHFHLPGGMHPLGVKSSKPNRKCRIRQKSLGGARYPLAWFRAPLFSGEGFRRDSLHETTSGLTIQR